MKSLKSVLNKHLNEGVLDMDDIDRGLIGEVELKSTLKKWGCAYYLKDHHLENKTLTLKYGSICYMKNLQNVADELDCNSFKIYPRASIMDTPTINGLHIETPGQIDISQLWWLDNCVLQSGYCIKLSSDRGSLDIKYTTVDTEKLIISWVNKFNFQGSDFSKVEQLTLARCGVNIQKIIENWGICEIDNKRICVPSDDKFDPSIDPLEDLGLDKYFKNLEQLNISTGTGGNDLYICYEKQPYLPANNPRVKYSKELDNGWTMRLIHDASYV